MKPIRKAINFFKGSNSRPQAASSSELGRMPAEMMSRIQWLRRPSSSSTAPRMASVLIDDGAAEPPTESDDEGNDSDTDTEPLGLEFPGPAGGSISHEDQIRVLLHVSEDSWDHFATTTTTTATTATETEPEESRDQEELDLNQTSFVREHQEIDDLYPMNNYYNALPGSTSESSASGRSTPRYIGPEVPSQSENEHDLVRDRDRRYQERRLHYHAAGRHLGRIHIPGAHIPAQMNFQGTIEEGRRLGYVSSSAVIHKYEAFGIFGLYNIGNTCYLNCVLQCLSHTRPFIEFVVDSEQFFNELVLANGESNEGHAGRFVADGLTTPTSTSGGVNDKLLVLCYKDLISTVWKYSPVSLSPSAEPHSNIGDPTELKKAMEKKSSIFQGEDQHDAHEFLHCFLDAIHAGLNRSTKKRTAKGSGMELESELAPLSNSASDQEHDRDDGDEPSSKLEEDHRVAWEKYLKTDNSIITDHFVGQLKSTLTCATCGLESVKYEPFWDLSVPITLATSGARSSRPKMSSLIECLQLLLEENTLDHDNLFYCTRCCGQERCSKRLQIERFPHILVLHLKRFSSLESKILTPVEYPVHGLDMGQFGVKRGVGVSYNLFGVVDHLGESVAGGHYIAHCKHPFNYFGNWYTHDDTSVFPVTPSDCSSDAYMLFYEMSLASRDILNI